jgi:hypothetical protein
MSVSWSPRREQDLVRILLDPFPGVVGEHGEQEQVEIALHPRLAGGRDADLSP